MLKYLNYITNELTKLIDSNIANTLIEEVALYKEYWKRYSSDSSINPLYNSIARFYNTHNFHLPTGETVSISWDIDRLYDVAKQQLPIHKLSLSDFEAHFQNELLTSADEFSRIACNVNSIHPHKYTPILIINFKPTQSSLIVDGRHRYMEYKKFTSSHLVPFYILDDELCFTNILLKKELLTYIILHNIEVINDFITGKGTLKRILNLKNCMRC